MPDTNHAPQILSDEPSVIRVSTNSSGEQADGIFKQPDISPDGTRVVFASSANLTGTASLGGIYIKNLATGAVTLVSTSVSGVPGNSDAALPEFSPDGTKVVFRSFASNLVGGDTNNAEDIFIKDLVTGAITRVSTDSSGAQANGSSDQVHFSADGTKVIFSSVASNLVAGDNNATYDIFVKDLTTGVTTRVSTGSSGAQADQNSDFGVLSPDGTKAAFISYAHNLGDNSQGYPNIVIKDLASGVVTRIAANFSDQGNQVPNMVFSDDGTKLIFSSNASGVVSGDTNNAFDVFMSDLTTGTVTRLSTSATGAQSNGDSYGLAVSADGTKVAFYSLATNLVAGDSDTRFDLFVKDVTTGAITRIAAGISTDAPFPAAFSADGSKLVFAGQSADLVSGDTNGTSDIFVALAGPVVSTGSVQEDAGLTTGAVLALPTAMWRTRIRFPSRRPRRGLLEC